MFIYNFFRWRFEALKSRCIIMNREMLLQQNNVNFEHKVPAIRQMVENLFGPNEDPLIEETFWSINNVKNNGGESSSDLSRIDENVTQLDNNWLEVKENFANLRRFTSTSENRRETYVNDDTMHHEDAMISLQNKKKSKDYERENKSNLTPGNSTAVIHMIEDKENTNEEMQKNKNSPKCLNDTSRVSSINEFSKLDQRGRVKQVNVEMFTVTLKRRDSPKTENNL